MPPTSLPHSSAIQPCRLNCINILFLFQLPRVENRVSALVVSQHNYLKHILKNRTKKRKKKSLSPFLSSSLLRFDLSFPSPRFFPYPLPPFLSFLSASPSLSLSLSLSLALNVQTSLPASDPLLLHRLSQKLYPKRFITPAGSIRIAVHGESPRSSVASHPKYIPHSCRATSAVFSDACLDYLEAFH